MNVWEKIQRNTLLIEKELDNGKLITYKIKLIDSFRFMSSPLSNLVNDLSEGLHNDNCTDCKSYMSVKSICI